MENPATNSNKKGLLAGFILLLALSAGFIALVSILPFGGGSSSEKLAAIGKDKIGVVEVFGAIMTAEETVRQIKEYANDKSIKAIIIRIDSPGGAVAPSQEIHDAILAARQKKKVVASMATLGASGGYYIAVAADKIICNPGTLTGSIGVIMNLMNVQELMGKIGVQPMVVKSGEFKDTGSAFRPMTEREKKVVQEMIDDVYGQFVAAVAKGRNMTEEKVRELADGRVYTGNQAKNNGMVDALGGMEEAVKLTAQLAGIEGEPALVRHEEKMLWLKEMMSEKMTGKFDWLLNEVAVHKPGVYYLWSMN